MVNILLLGDSKAGKSSLLYRLVEDKFSESYMATVGKSFGKFGNVVVHDTSGSDRFYDLNSVYYAHTDGAVIMYDVTTDFESIEKWKVRLLDIVCQDIPILIIGNKIDLKVDYEKIDDVQYVSCKTGENVLGAINAFIPLLKANPTISVGVSDRLFALLSSCLQQ